MYPLKKGRLTIQCDEMWSFVGNKGNKQWIWLALDIETRKIIEVHIGDRSEQGAKKLWDSLPSGAIWFFIHHYNSSLLV
jgi:insertion element IS1 protein InsB